MRSLLILACAIALAVPAFAQSRTIEVQLQGFDATVTFSQADADSPVQVSTNFDPTIVVEFGIGTLPVPDNGDCRDVGEVQMIGEYNQTVTLLEGVNLTLFGEQTLIGRGLVVFGTSVQRRQTCATIGFPTTNTVDIADVSLFCPVTSDNCILGNVRFLRGNTANGEEELIVISELNYEAPDVPTGSIQWAIHSSDIGPLDVDCQGVGANVLLEGGDVQIHSARDGTYRYRHVFPSFTHPIEGASIVFGATEAPLSCANILEWSPAPVRTRTVSATFADSSASLVFVDHGDGSPIAVEVDVEAIFGAPVTGNVNIAVHTLPIIDNDCSTSGDALSAEAVLSGGATSVNMDITLFGKNTVMGRSIVLTAESESRCANIGFHGPTLVQVADFAADGHSQGEVVGTMTFTQAYVPEEEVKAHGDLSETIIVVDLYTTGTPTTGHNWHVHQKPVDPNEPNVCIATALHFDPFVVCNWLPGCEAPYGYICTPDSPKLCEIGDQSKKLAKIDLPAVEGRQRLVFVDVQLPLFGAYSAAGRSIVIHAEDGGAARIACADLRDPTPVEETMSVTVDDFQVALSQIDGVLTLTTDIAGEQLQSITVHEMQATSTDECLDEVGPLFGRGGGRFYWPEDETPTGAISLSTNTLTLTGGNTIIGRTLVITTNVGSRCGVIGVGENVVVREAHFNESTCTQGEACLVGTVTVTESLDWDATLISSSLHYFSMPTPKANIWSIEDNNDAEFDPAQICGGDGCMDYEQRCHPGAPDQCRAGDLVGKHGTILVRTADQYVPRLFIDRNLPLNDLPVASESIARLGVGVEAAALRFADLPLSDAPATTATTTTTNGDGTTTTTTTTNGDGTTTTTTTNGDGTTTTTPSDGTTATTVSADTTTTTAGDGNATTTDASTGDSTAATTTTDDSGTPAPARGGLTEAEKVGLGIGITVVVAVVLALVFVSQKRTRTRPYHGISGVDSKLSNEDDELVFALHPQDSRA